MMINYLIIILILINFSKVFTLNQHLIDLEKNLLFTQLKNSTDLERLFRKINIDDLKSLSQIITEKDIQNLNVDNKVKENFSLFV